MSNFGIDVKFAALLARLAPLMLTANEQFRFAEELTVTLNFRRLNRDRSI